VGLTTSIYNIHFLPITNYMHHWGKGYWNWNRGCFWQS